VAKTVNKRSAKISTFGVAIVSMLHGYSRQSAFSQQQLCYLCFFVGVGVFFVPWSGIFVHSLDGCEFGFTTWVGGAISPNC